MMKRFVLFFLTLSISSTALALYKCQDAIGKIEYRSDSCTTSADITPQSVKQVPGKAKKYLGEKIKLNFNSVDLRVIFQVIGDFSGKKVRLGKEVQGNISARFEASWDQVLDQLAARYRLTISVEGDEIIVNENKS